MVLLQRTTPGQSVLGDDTRSFTLALAGAINASYPQLVDVAGGGYVGYYILVDKGQCVGRRAVETDTCR